MIFGFAITHKGTSKFGVVKADTDVLAKQSVVDSTGAAPADIAIINAAEALDQFDDVAYLAPAEG